MVKSILNTLKVVAATQGIALPIAICIAWVLARTNVPFARTLEFGFWMLFFLPSARRHHGLAAVLRSRFRLGQPRADLARARRRPTFNLYSYWGIVFVQSPPMDWVKVMLLTRRSAIWTPRSRRRPASAARALQDPRSGGAALMTPAILVVLLMSVIRDLEVRGRAGPRHADQVPGLFDQDLLLMANSRPNTWRRDASPARSSPSCCR
jgi:hypothetical protein